MNPSEADELKQETTRPALEYLSILLAVDSSDYSNHGIGEAVKLAGLWNAQITATHAYAAKMHDVRFRQMEGGLPEPFREEQELERQRDVHDDLITRGLSIITDSYLDQVDTACKEHGFKLNRRALEGKNYRALVNETNSGNYDLLIIGALGLGAVKGSRIGTVCGRVARRSDIDVLVIKDIKKNISEGPVVVAVDGSTRAYGGLLTAFELARKFSISVKVIAAFDPYYHYVAFNRIAGVLSEEAGKVFKFKEQEKLHEEIIDSGLAKIYEGHLSVAESIAENFGITIETELLAGKAHDAIEKYIHKVKPSLLVIGKLGIHADPDLDIGGNAENLLHNVDCSILLSQREHQPELDVLADATTSWTKEAEKRMERVPEFVQNMARMAILRYAQERGHTVITESIVEEATAQLMPGRAEQAMSEIVAAYDQKNQEKGILTDKAMQWTDEAESLLLTIKEQSLRDNLKMRAEKMARTEKSNTVDTEHISAFLDDPIEKEFAEQGETELYWDAAAIARLMRAPEGFMRDMSKARIEEYASEHNLVEITLEIAEQGLSIARKTMEQELGADTAVQEETKVSKCPFAHLAKSRKKKPADKLFVWTDQAEQRMTRIPEGFMRDMTRRRVENFARKHGEKLITKEVVEQKYADWAKGSEKQERNIPWDEESLARTEKIPPFVCGMVIKEVERCAREMDKDSVDVSVLENASGSWAESVNFHSEANPDQYAED